MSIIQKISGWGGPVVSGNPVDGDLVRVTYDNGCIAEHRYTTPSTNTSKPSVLSSTGFDDYCASQLGGGSAGYARLQEILEAAKGFVGNSQTARQVRYSVGRFERARDINKTVVATFLGILLTAGLITAQENDNIINNWPTT